jgi:hypothetical protein
MTDVYYADLFIINGKGCVIMGHGKSVVCRNHTDESTEEISSDFVCFDINKDGRLCALSGYVCMIAPLSVNRASEESIPVDYFIYMRDERTAGAYSEVQELTADEFRNIADFNITFGVQGVKERRREFIELISSSPDIKYIAVPWCESVEEKGTLLFNYLKEQK